MTSSHLVSIVLGIALIFVAVYAAQNRRKKDAALAVKLQLLSPADPELLPIVTALKAKNMIEAARLYCEHTGCDLYEARYAMQLLTKKMSSQDSLQ